MVNITIDDGELYCWTYAKIVNNLGVHLQEIRDCYST